MGKWTLPFVVIATLCAAGLDAAHAVVPNAQQQRILLPPSDGSIPQVDMRKSI